MDDVLDYIAGTVATLFIIVSLGVLILWGLLLIALAWFVISAGIAWIERRRLLKEAQDIFDEVREKNIPQVQVDPLLQAIFGEELDLPPVNAKNTDDWLTETLFGTS